MAVFTRTLAALLSALLLAPAVATTTTAQAAPITWESCPLEVTRPGARCGRIEVPMDYANPGGEKISVGFIYFGATHGAKDTIFVNPGGPGGSVYQLPGSTNEPFPAEFFQNFTIVGVQPRGLPGSTPVDCVAGLESAGMDQHLFHAGGLLRQSCEQTRPGYTATITTANTARDWEEVRKALGLASISIYGWSYGTILGSTYATLFPERTNRVVLDSGVDTELMWAQVMINQEAGYNGALHDFFAWAAQRNDEYGLGTTPYQVYRSWAESIRQETGAFPPALPPARTQADLPPQSSGLGQAAVDALNAVERPRAETESLLTQSQSGSVAGSSILYSGTLQLLPMPRHWDTIAKGVRNRAEISSLFVAMYGEQPDTRDIMTSAHMQQVIMCNESVNPPRPELFTRFVWQAFVAQDPVTVAPSLIDSGANCNGSPAVTRVPALNGAGLKVRPLQLQPTGDPQTPYGHFWNMRAQMNSHLITVHGPGHGAFGVGNPAVDRVVLDYFSGGTPTVTDLPGIFG